VTYAYVVVAREHGVAPAYLLELIRAEQAKGYAGQEAFRRALQVLFARYDDIADD
jgi:hypothetical protein